MGSATLTIRPTISESNHLTSTLNRAKTAVEKLFSLMKSPDPIEKKVIEVIDKTIDHAEKYSGKKYGDRKDQVKKNLVIARTHEEAALACAEGHVFVSDEKKQRFISKKTKKPSKGTFDKKFSRIVIDLQSIMKSHHNEKTRNACLVMTTMDETLHSLCKLEKYHQHNFLSRYNIKWLIEAMTESLSEMMLQELYPNDSKNLECQSYPLELRAINGLADIVSYELLAASYFEGNLFAFTMRLVEEGLTNSEIAELLHRGDAAESARNDGEKDRRLRELVDCVEYHQKKVNARRAAEKRKKKRKIEREDEDSSTSGNQKSAPRRLGEEGNKTKGLSKATLDAVKTLLPNNETDTANRLTLDACLFYHLQKGHEPTTAEVFDLVQKRLDAAHGITAQVSFDLLSEATSGMAIMSPPQTEAGVNRQSQNEWRMFEEFRTGLEQGESFAHQYELLFEAVAIDHMIKNGGDLPSPDQISATIFLGVNQIYTQEGLVPDLQILTTQIHANTQEAVSGSFGIGDPVLIDSLNDLVDTGGVDPQIISILDKLYCQELAPEMQSFISASELQSYGPVVLDRAVTYFTEQGVTPTCGELIGFISMAVGISEQTRTREMYGDQVAGLNVPEDPKGNGALFTIECLRQTTLEQLGSERLSAPVDQRLAEEYWRTKIDYSKQTGAIDRSTAETERMEFRTQTTEKLAVATQMFVSAIKIERPSDKVAYDPKSLIVVVDPSGKVQKVNQFNYLGALMTIVGATGLGSDPRKVENEGLEVSGELIENLSRVKRSDYESYKSIPKSGSEIVERIQKAYEEPYEQLCALFEVLKTKGKMGITGTLYVEDRPKGSKSIAEVFETKQADCLEITIAFTELAKKMLGPSVKVFPMEVVNIQKRMELGHVCVGVLIDYERVDGNPNFNNDPMFRRKILEDVGIEDRKDLKLLVIDPINGLFDHRFHKVRMLTDNQVESYFFSNSALYKKNKGGNEELEMAKAKSAWPNNPYVIAYEIRKIADTRLAIDLMQQVDETDRTADFYFDFANRLAEVGRKKEALTAIDRSLRMDQNDGLAWWVKAELHLETDSKPELVELSLERAIQKLRGSRVAATRSIYRATLAGKNLDSDLAGVSKKNFEFGLMKIYELLILHHISFGQISKAQQVCKRALSLEPRNVEILKLSAVIFAIMADYELHSGNRKHSKKLAKESLDICDKIQPKKWKSTEHDELVRNIRMYVRNITENRLGIEEQVTATMNGETVVLADFRTWEMDSFFAACVKITGEERIRISPIKEKVYGSKIDFTTFKPIRIEKRKKTNTESRIGRIVKKVFEAQREKAAQILRIKKSWRLNDDEKSLLIGIINSPMKGLEVQVFIAINHQELMGKTTKSLHHERASEYRKLASSGSMISFNDAIKLAKLGLGEKVFEEKCREITELLDTDPLRIDRKMLRRALGLAKQQKYTRDELMAITIRALQTTGQPITEARISNILPEIEKHLKHPTSLIGKTGGLDVNKLKYLS